MGIARCSQEELRCSAMGTRINFRHRSPQSMRHSLLADASSQRWTANVPSLTLSRPAFASLACRQAHNLPPS